MNIVVSNIRPSVRKMLRSRATYPIAESIDDLLGNKFEDKYIVYFNELMYQRHNNDLGSGFLASTAGTDSIAIIPKNVVLLDESGVHGFVEIRGPGEVVLKKSAKIISYGKKITVTCTNGRLTLTGNIVIGADLTVDKTTTLYKNKKPRD